MENWAIPVFVGVAAPLLALVTTLVMQWMQRHKTEAEARSTDADYGVKVTASAVTLINELQDEVHQLRERQKVIDIERQAEHKEMVKLRNEVKRLQQQVMALRRENSLLHDELKKLKGLAQ